MISLPVFIIACVIMAAIAVGLILRPLLRKPEHEADGRMLPIATALSLVLLAGGLYYGLHTWEWGEPALVAGTEAERAEALIARLEARLAEAPDDVDGWLMLGRTLMSVERYPRAVEAYQQAFDRTQGDNVTAITGLAEALIMTDEASLGGRAGQLLEAALQKAPRDPRALWFGSLAALEANRLDVARDRMRLLLSMNPPEQVATLLEQQIEVLNTELDGPEGGAMAHAVSVEVSLAPALVTQVPPSAALFILARETAGGPPLAVVRRGAGELPLTVQLSDADAMIAGRNLGAVAEAQIVARISRGGSPQAQSGDLYGEASYTVQPGSGSVRIVIDRVVP